jgi:hypothetical protein
MKGKWGKHVKNWMKVKWGSNSHSFFLSFNLSFPSAHHYQLPTTHQECQTTTTPNPTLDPPLEAFNEEMAHGLLLLYPWSSNPNCLDNVETDYHLPQVITDNVLVTTSQVPVLDCDDWALNPGVGKGLSVPHINKTPADRHFVCNLVT